MNISQWFGSLQTRERYLLIGGAFVLFLLALYVFLLEPLSSDLKKLQAQDTAGNTQLAWMKKAQAEVRTLNSNQSRPNADLKTSLITAVERSSSSKGIRAQIKRIEPQGQKKISVELSSVSFDQLINWIGFLENKYGAKVTQFHSTMSDKPGRVDSRVIFSRESS